jgi:hypothetical protein
VGKAIKGYKSLEYLERLDNIGHLLTMTSFKFKYYFIWVKCKTLTLASNSYFVLFSFLSLTLGCEFQNLTQYFFFLNHQYGLIENSLFLVQKNKTNKGKSGGSGGGSSWPYSPEVSEKSTPNDTS